MTRHPAAPTSSGTARALGLGEAWETTLRNQGAEIGDSHAWRRRLIAATEPLTVADLRVVALRLQGLPPSAIAMRRSRKRLVRADVERLCLAVAVRLTSDDAGPSWRLLGVGRSGRELVRNAMPPERAVPNVPQTEFDRLWLKGHSKHELRDLLAIGPAAVERFATQAPPRWFGREIAAHLGWSRENHRLRLARGHFPEPDGRDGLRNWWWPDTVIVWARGQRLVPCPACGAQVERLKQHWRMHSLRQHSPA